MQLTPVDVALLGAVLLFVGIGLFRGFSGELASLSGFVAAVVAGYIFYDFVHMAVKAFGFNKGDAVEIAAAGVADFVIALLAFGIVRWFVDKFISLLVPQPTNALLGALSGAFKGFVLLALLTGIGFLRPGTYSKSCFSEMSGIVRLFASYVDSYCKDMPQFEIDIPVEDGLKVLENNL